MLGIILALLLLILFAPFRYRISGSFRDNVPAGEATVKWLLGILGVRAAYQPDGKLVAYVSVLGFRVYNILKDDKDEKTNADEEDELSWDDDFLMPADYDGEIYSGTAVSGTGSETLEQGNAISGKSNRIYSAEKAERKAIPAIQAKSGQSEESASTDADANALSETDLLQAENKPFSPNDVIQMIREFPSKIRNAVSGLGQSLLGKLADLINLIEEKLNAFDRKVTEKINQIKETVKAAIEQIRKRSDQAKALYALYKLDANQPALNMLKNRIVRILKEICPRKGKGRVMYGSGDPFSTGQTMQIAVMLYPLIEKHIEVIPDFDRQIIDAELNIKGRIRLIVAAEAALRVFFSKRLRKIYKQARVILELDS